MIYVRSGWSVEGAKLLAKTQAERLVQNVSFPIMFRDQTNHHQYVLSHVKNVLYFILRLLNPQHE